MLFYGVYGEGVRNFGRWFGCAIIGYGMRLGGCILEVSIFGFEC